MIRRRRFIASTALLGPAAASAMPDSSKTDNNTSQILGAWSTTHRSALGTYRQMLSFSEGGVLSETDTWLTPSSNMLTQSWRLNPFPLVINGSDGAGNWERLSPGEVKVSFRKLLYQGSGVFFRHYGDFWAKGTIIVSSGLLKVTWSQLRIVDLNDTLLIDFGIGTSEGTRI